MLVQFINDLNLGGAQKICVNISVNLDDSKRSKIIVIFPEIDAHYQQTLKENGVEVIKIAKSPLKAIATVFKAKVVFVHLFPALYLGLFFKLFKKSLVFIEHSTSNRRRKFKVLRLIDKHVYKSYSDIICVSEIVKKSICSVFPDLENKTIVISNGIDTQQKKKVSKRERSKKVKIMGSLGRVVEAKNYKRLIEAYYRSQIACELWIAGEGTELIELKELVNNYGLEKKVKFVGRTTNVHHFFSELDYYVQPSIWEGYGLSVLESQLHNIPIALSNIPAFKEFKFRPHQYFDPLDIGNMSHVLVRLVKHSQNFELTPKELKILLQANSVERMLNKYKVIYEKYQ